MKILIVEPWLEGSHLAWASGYRYHSAHDVDIIGLPGRLWRWRLRGGALPLAESLTSWIDLNGQPDMLLISGLVDVAELLGLARRNLAASTAVVVYQHESQLVYPVPGGNFDYGAALRNWMSWCAADLVLFNSYYHMRAVHKALPKFIDRLPDDTHTPALQPVLDKFEVFPVGVDVAAVQSVGSSLAGGDTVKLPSSEDSAQDSAIDAGDAAPIILWPHRWERDKDSSAFVAALRKLDASGLDFRLILAGQDPTSGSKAAEADRRLVETEFADRLLASGPFEREDYLKHLWTADLVVSCARHEFFGVAIIEAVAAGCVPLLPHSLSYPELIRPPWHEASLYEPGTFGESLISAVGSIEKLRREVIGLAETMDRFDWSRIAQVYDHRFEVVLSRTSGGVHADLAA